MLDADTAADHARFNRAIKTTRQLKWAERQIEKAVSRGRNAIWMDDPTPETLRELRKLGYDCDRANTRSSWFRVIEEYLISW